MPFQSGTVSFARFDVEGGPSEPDGEALEALGAHVIRPPAVGAAPQIQAGWVAPGHVYDTDFDAEAVLFGPHMLFGLRIDTNRLPAEIRRAHRAMAEAARSADSETGFTSRREKRDAREEADEQCRRELATGRHVRSRMLPVLWNVRKRLLYCPVFSDTAAGALRDLFEATFNAALEPLSAGGLARRLLARRGARRDYEDLTPSPFTSPPAAARGEEGRDVSTPVAPWSFAGPEPKDFLGNEFLIWLWAQSEIESALIETSRGEVAVAIDRALDMDCAWNVTGKLTLRADQPTRLPEPARALQIGKWPRKAGLIVAARGEQWEFMFQADRFLITGCKIPRPEEAPASPREAIEQRLASLEALDEAMVGLFDVFLTKRTSSAWPAERQTIGHWIAERAGARPGRAGAKVEITA